MKRFSDHPRKASTASLIEHVRAVTIQLLEYCRNKEWSGYDPYDALNSKLVVLLPFLNTKVPRLVFTQVLKRFPFNIRKFLFIPETKNPKALALFLSSFIKLSKHGLLPNNELIEKMVDELVIHRSKDTSYWCWGYSFPWQTRTILVRKGSPNLVCTVFVANSLLDAYEYNNEKRCLDMAISAANYLLTELYWTKGEREAGFGYPLPSVRVPVHNANFLAASFLSRVYNYTKEKAFIDAALTVTRYSLSKQQADGSWAYGESSKQTWVDNFHTGYNLCALRIICQYTETSSEFESSIQRGFKFYKEHFFRDDGAPKYFHNKTYPIDIHSVAQSIITILTFKDYDPQNAEALINSIFNWSFNNLWNNKGYFYYQKLPLYKNKIPYMRWSEAWMLLALSTILDSYLQND